jgi:Na+-transporting NADH:ubiquinone oxidoreductase subunit NqrC
MCSLVDRSRESHGQARMVVVVVLILFSSVVIAPKRVLLARRQNDCFQSRRNGSKNRICLNDTAVRQPHFFRGL